MSNEDLLFASIAVDLGHVAREVAAACLEESAARRVGVAEVLRERGLLDEVREAQVRRALLERTLVVCPTCGRRQGAGASACESCGAPTGVAAGDSTRASAPARPGSPPPHDRIGDHELLGVIARGGMGVVYKARNLRLGRVVALKVVAGLQGSRQTMERLQREARAAARLHHPGIVPIYELGTENGVPYFTMELVEGGSLEEAMTSPGFTLAGGLAWMREVCEAVDYAHVNGVLHRDLKPSNILLAGGTRPVVTDFGLVKDRGAADLTRTGELVGTPFYVAPEQVLSGSRVDERADVYSLGVVLYRMASRGRYPIEADTTMELLVKISQGERVPLAARARDLDRDITTMIDTAVSPDSARRYRSARALGKDLDAYLEGRPLAARPPGAFERWRQTYRENRVAMNLVGLMILLLAGFGIHATVMQERLRDERDRALEARAEAHQQRELARARARRLAAALDVVSEERREKESERSKKEKERAEKERERAEKRAFQLVQRADELFRARGDRLRIEAMLEKADRMVPGYPRTLRLRGEMALDDRDWPRARRLLEKALAGDPKDYRSSYLMFRWYDDRGRGLERRAQRHLKTAARYGTDDAIGWLGKVIARLATTRLLEEPERSARLRTLVGYCDRALARRKEFALARNYRGILHRRLGAYRKALADFDEVVRLRRFWPQAHFNRAMVLMHMKRFREALDALDQTLGIDSRHALAYRNRGVVLDRLGRPADALREYDRAVRHGFDPVELALDRAGAYTHLGDHGRALADYRKYIERHPGRPIGYNARALVWKHINIRLLLRAYHDLTWALYLAPRRASYLANRGGLLHAVRLNHLALADFERALRLDPNLALAHHNKGVVVMGVKRYRAALEHFGAALRIDPWDVRSLAFRGDCLSLLGRFDEAKAALDEAIRIDPRSLIALDVRGLMHLRRRAYRKALADWRKALGLSPSPWLRAKLERLIRTVERRLRRRSGS